MRDVAVADQRAAHLREQRDARALDGVDRVVGGAAGPQRHPRERQVRIAHELRELVRRDARAEMLGRDVLELVRLVEDHRVVIGQHARAGMRGAQRAIGEVEVVIDEDQLGLLGEPPRLRDEAALEVRTARADARIRRRRHLGPHRRGLGEPLDLGAIAGLGVLGPVDERAELIRFRAARHRASASRRRHT